MFPPVRWLANCKDVNRNFSGSQIFYGVKTVFPYEEFALKDLQVELRPVFSYHLEAEDVAVYFHISQRRIHVGSPFICKHVHPVMRRACGWCLITILVF